MKLLIVSDTHRKNNTYFELLQEIEPDMVIHCGDSEGSEYALTEAADCPVHLVSGNNDFFSELPKEINLEIEGYRFWVTHGHNYYVSMGNERIVGEAQSRGIDVVLYGHTHRPIVEKHGNILAINPGSLSYPRQEGHRPSYVLLTVDKGRGIEAEIYYL